MSAIYLKEINSPASVMISDMVRKLKRQGEKIHALQTGDPDFTTPEVISKELNTFIAKGFTHYSDSQGVIDLREAVAVKCARFNNTTIDPENEVLVTNGGIHAYYVTMGALFNSGDEVLIPDPTWTSHMNVAMATGVVPVMVPAHYENGYIPDIADWESRITPDTKALVINYPSNPTGAIPSQSYLKELVALAKKYDLLIISDEVYEHIIYDAHQPASIAAIAGAKDRTISIFSFSKSYAMTGWRLGYITAPAAIISKIKKLSQYTITNVATFIQLAGAFALNSPVVEEEVANMLKIYAKRRALVQEILDNEAKGLIDYFMPQGAFYFFLNLKKYNKSSVEIANELLVKYRVATVPGSAYGKFGEGHLRITIAANESDIENGLKGILDWIENQ